jgi:nitrite reductase (NADH) small subunit/3-phenylpropionate/trans-cinnamate dioxygenase ferredoxin subunit
LPEAGFVPVARTHDVPPGTGKVVEANGRLIALFNVAGTFYALDNTCLHRGGPVGEGDLEDAIVTCPWHGFQYDVTTGRNVFDVQVGLETFAVRVEGDEVSIAV